MRTLAILAVVVLAGRPASAASILIDSIDSTGLLPVELLLASSSLDVPDADSDADEDALSAIALRLVPHAIGAAGGEATLDAGDAIAAASDDVWSGYRPVVTSEVVHAIHGGGLVSPYTIEPVANTESLAGLAVDTPGATELAFALKTVKVMDDYVANPCYILLPITGALMVHVAGYPWKLLWIHMSLALLVVLAALGFGVYSPTLRKQIAALERGGPTDPEFVSLGRRGAMLGGIMGVVVFAILGLMVYKPV
jgi:uncharacterized membrane protein